MVFFMFFFSRHPPGNCMVGHQETIDFDYCIIAAGCNFGPFHKLGHLGGAQLGSCTFWGIRSLTISDPYPGTLGQALFQSEGIPPDIPGYPKYIPNIPQVVASLVGTKILWEKSLETPLVSKISGGANPFGSPPSTRTHGPKAGGWQSSMIPP